MTCTKCKQRIIPGLQPYHRTKKGSHHARCPHPSITTLVDSAVTSTTFTAAETIEMMNLVGLAEHEFKVRDTKLHARIKEMLDQARASWRAKWKGRPCPCCGKIVE